LIGVLFDKIMFDWCFIIAENDIFRTEVEALRTKDHASESEREKGLGGLQDVLEESREEQITVIQG
jgi:hypothetical protein